MTLEEALAEIVRLNEALETEKAEKESYRTQAADTAAELEKVRGINQQYFLKLTAQYTPATDPADPGEPEAPACEDFAKTLTI